jgi:hypothetical protein
MRAAQHSRTGLLWSSSQGALQHALTASEALIGSTVQTEVHYVYQASYIGSEQQAWLPQHTALARLVSAFQDTAQQVRQGLSAGHINQHNSNSSSSTQLLAPKHTQHAAAVQVGWPAVVHSRCCRKMPRHHTCTCCLTQAFSSSTSADSRAYTSSIRAYSSDTQNHSSRGSSPSRGTNQQQQQHTRNSNSSSSSSSSSRSHVGRIHRPLFSQHGITRSQAAAAALSSDEDDEGDYEQQLHTDPTDLRNPEQWYPAARAMAPRGLIAHLGPTNRWACVLGN